MKKYSKGFIMGLLVATLLMNVALGETVKKTIEVVYNSVNLTVNGKKVDADNILYNGTTYVPLRAISEMLGKEVGWDQATSTASINDKKAEGPKKEEPKKEESMPETNNYTFGSSFIYDSYSAKMKVSMGNNYSFDTIKNQFSDKNGDVVIRIPVTVENIGDKTGYLFSGHIKAYNSMGNSTSLSIYSYFDDGRNIYENMRPGAKATGAIYILYSGDGDYYLDIEYVGSDSVELKLPIRK